MDMGGFPVDLVLFGMIAAFLVLRLRSILGRRTGFERPPAQPYQPPQRAGNGPVIEGRAEAVNPPSSGTVPEPGSPIGQTLGRMRSVDRSFDPASFLGGAEQAFRIVVNAFAKGERDEFRPLVSDEVFRAFDQAIAERSAAGQSQTSEVKSVEAATIEEAALRDSVAQITVRFVSDQVSITRDKGGEIVAGTDSVTEITDVWTFERDLSSRDPTWRLVAVRNG